MTDNPKNPYEELVMKILEEKDKQIKELKISTIISNFVLSMIAFAALAVNFWPIMSFMSSLPVYTATTTEEMSVLSHVLTVDTCGITSANILSEWVYENIVYSKSGDLTPEETFRLRRGVCKEKAALLATMLRTLGYEASVEVVDSGSHAITKVMEADGFFYCDPTNGSPYYDKGYGKTTSFCWYPN